MSYMDTSKTEEANETLLDNIIIPSRPTILLKIQKAQTDKDGVNLLEIAELIAQDIGLSAAVLKTINSAYYGLADKVSSIRQAVFLLGMNRIYILVAALSLRKIAETSRCLDLDLFWDHSVEIASSSVFIAQHLDNINTDDAQLFGLFHDCGKVLLAQQFDDYQETLKTAAGIEDSLINFERLRHGTDHALVGALLSHAWCLPTSITLAIRHHHAITAFREGILSDEVLALLAVNFLAESLTNHNNDYNYNEWSIHADEFMETLKITENDVMNLRSEWQTKQPLS